jgi:regulator of cell morphogenesis and NO signaling
MINETMTLADVVKKYPQTIPYLNELHLDYCCGGHDQIKQLAKDKKVDKEELLDALNKIIEKAPTKTNNTDDLERFRRLSVDEMLTDLEETHHVKERELMAQAEMYLNKILIVHYPHHGEFLTKLHHLYSGLKADLEEHFAKEERLLFPLMQAHPNPTTKEINAVKVLEDEHSSAGEIIKEIQLLTNNFELPDDACPTFAHTYDLIQELFEDIFIHIFKENSIAFPEYYEKGE